MARLANKVAIITGAARGIGRAIALRFAEEGCLLGLSDLNLSGVQETARECEAKSAMHGVRTTTFPTNVTNRSDVEAMIAGTAEQLGRGGRGNALHRHGTGPNGHPRQLDGARHHCDRDDQTRAFRTGTGGGLDASHSAAPLWHARRRGESSALPRLG